MSVQKSWLPMCKMIVVMLICLSLWKVLPGQNRLSSMALTAMLSRTLLLNQGERDRTFRELSGFHEKNILYSMFVFCNEYCSHVHFVQTKFLLP